jgi:Ca2+/Na+ antiporter
MFTLWIIGVGLLGLAFILAIRAVISKNLLKFRRITFITTSIMFILIAIPVLSVQYISKDLFIAILVANYILMMIIIIVGFALALKALNLHLWYMPYDNESEKEKLQAHKNLLEKPVVDLPIFFGIMLLIYIVFSISLLFE